MIDFKNEINKYKPVLNVDDVASDVSLDEIKDLMDLLQYIKERVSNGEEQVGL